MPSPIPFSILDVLHIDMLVRAKAAILDCEKESMGFWGRHNNTTEVE